MSSSALKGSDLKKHIKLVKQSGEKGLGFAFSPGAGKDEPVFILSRRKEGAKLSKELKAEFKRQKVAFGRCTIDGKLMMLKCDKELGALARNMKKFLKGEKKPFNVVVLDSEGNELESDIEDLPDDPDDDQDLLEDQDSAEDEDADDQDSDSDDQDADDSEQDSGPPDQADQDTEDQSDADQVDEDQDDSDQDAEPQPVAAEQDAPAGDASALTARLRALQPGIAGASGSVADTLTRLFQIAVGQIKSGDLVKAEEIVVKLEDAVSKLPPPKPKSDQEPAEGEDAKSLAARAKAAKEVIAGVAPTVQDKLNKALAGAIKALKGGDTKTAAAMLDKIEAALAKMKPAASAKDDGADDVQDDGGAIAQIAASRQGWAKTRSNLSGQIDKLKSEIEKTTAGISGLEEVASRTGVLFERLEELDGTLVDELDALTGADADARGSHMANAQQIISRYRNVLDSPFFQAVDNNGFLNTSIRADALASLDDVTRALNAA